MKFTILGSGSWEGIPAPFAQDQLSRNARGKDIRTRPQFLVEGTKPFMIEISPDIRIQSQGLPPIGDFLISHWHFDHCYGLLELDAFARSHQNITIYCSKHTADWINTTFAHITFHIIIVKAFKPFILHGVQIIPFPVYHMRDGLKEDNVFGFLLDGKIAYLSDYFSIPETSWQLIKTVKTLIADGTYLFEEHFLPEFEQQKKDPDHLHGKEVEAYLKSHPHVVFHSIGRHTGKNHDQLESMVPRGWQISFDGMVLKN